VSAVTVRSAEPGEKKALHRLGDAAVVAALTTDDGRTLLAAAAAGNRTALQGPFAGRSARTGPWPRTAAGNG
jgi:hypothetical protein